MKCLSIKQPWAWLIVNGFKDVENRDWPIGRRPQHGQYQSQKADFRLSLPTRIYVHAGKTVDEAVDIDMIDVIDQRLPIDRRAEFWRLEDDDGWGALLGAIIGEVTITGCVTASASPWFVGKYGFTLANPVAYKTPIPYLGQLGFFEVPDELREQPR